MKTYRKNAENALIQDLRDLYAQRDYWCGWHFHLSDLQIGMCTRQNLSTLFNFIKMELSEHKVLLYCCHDHDLLMFFPKTAQPPLENIKKKMHYFYATDPLLCDPPKGKTFATHFCLKKNYDSIFMEAHRKLLKSQEATKEPDDEMPQLDPISFQFVLEKRRTRTRPQVLIVDDHPFNRNMIAEALAGDAQIIMAKDGYEALNYYCKSAPDIVFLDIDMPKLDGHSVLEILSRLDPDAFIIMLTAKNKQEDVIKAKRNNAHGYITKPFNVHKLHQYIDLYQARQSVLP